MEKPYLIISSSPKKELTKPKEAITLNPNSNYLVKPPIKIVEKNKNFYSKIDSNHNKKDPDNMLYLEDNEQIDSEKINNLYKYYSSPLQLPQFPSVNVTPERVENALRLVLLTLIGSSLFIQMGPLTSGGKSLKKKYNKKH